MIQPSPRDWPEDFSHENGHYMNKCSKCGNIFLGHKRRFECKECATKPEQVNQPSGSLQEYEKSFVSPEKVMKDSTYINFFEAFSDYERGAIIDAMQRFVIYKPSENLQERALKLFPVEMQPSKLYVNSNEIDINGDRRAAYIRGATEVIAEREKQIAVGKKYTKKEMNDCWDAAQDYGFNMGQFQEIHPNKKEFFKSLK